MRPQAVPPTRTAPTTANVSRQTSDGMPICASPRSRMVAGNGGGHGIEQSDRCADQRRADRREDNLPNRQGRAAGEASDNERADHAGATVKGSEAG